MAMRASPRSAEYANYSQAGEFGREIEAWLGWIERELMQHDPTAAPSLAEAFIYAADIFVNRADDSGCVIGDAVRAGCVLWGEAAARCRGAASPQVVRQPCRAARLALGVSPVQRLNARLNEVCSAHPSPTAICTRCSRPSCSSRTASSCRNSSTTALKLRPGSRRRRWRVRSDTPKSLPHSSEHGIRFDKWNTAMPLSRVKRFDWQ